MAARGRKIPHPDILPPSQESMPDPPPELMRPDPDSPRGRILKAARDLIAAHGVRGTSTRAIAEAARVNLAMIHYYYRNKDHLYEQVLLHEIHPLAGKVMSTFRQERAVDEVLLGMPFVIMQELRERPELTALLRREIAAGATHLRNVILRLGDHGPLHGAQLFAGLVERAIRQRRIRKVDPNTLRECLIVVAFGSMLVDPVAAVFYGREQTDDAHWEQWRKTWTLLLRHGLLVEDDS